MMAPVNRAKSPLIEKLAEVRERHWLLGNEPAWPKPVAPVPFEVIEAVPSLLIELFLCRPHLLAAALVHDQKRSPERALLPGIELPTVVLQPRQKGVHPGVKLNA